MWQLFLFVVVSASWSLLHPASCLTFCESDRDCAPSPGSSPGPDPGPGPGVCIHSMLGLVGHNLCLWPKTRVCRTDEDCSRPCFRCVITRFHRRQIRTCRNVHKMRRCKGDEDCEQGTSNAVNKCLSGACRRVTGFLCTRHDQCEPGRRCLPHQRYPEDLRSCRMPVRNPEVDRCASDKHNISSSTATSQPPQDFHPSCPDSGDVCRSGRCVVNTTRTCRNYQECLAGERCVHNVVRMKLRLYQKADGQGGEEEEEEVERPGFCRRSYCSRDNDCKENKTCDLALGKWLGLGRCRTRPQCRLDMDCGECFDCRAGLCRPAVWRE